jgi:pyridoxine 5-phosphate synthase
MIGFGLHLELVALLRATRGGLHPDLLAAAHAAHLGGADHVVVPVRADRRRADERDARHLQESGVLPVHLEIAPTTENVAFATQLRPAGVVLVPEPAGDRPAGRGLDVASEAARVTEAAGALADAGILVAISTDPDEAQLVAANGAGALAVELHAGRYAAAAAEDARVHEFLALSRSAASARALGLRVHVGHGLDYGNVTRVAALPDVEVVRGGHAVIARAMFTGLHQAVAAMRERLVRAAAEEAPIP